MSLKGLKRYDDLHWPKFTDRRGRVFIYNFTKPGSEPTELLITGDIDLKRFNPHGLSVWQDPTSGIQVYITMLFKSKGSRWFAMHLIETERYGILEHKGRRVSPLRRDRTDGN